MLKFATAMIIAASLGDQQRVTKAAHRAVFEYEPRPGYLYVRSRAISSRTNDNHDAFPAEEIAKAYKTFIGKPVFVNHVNSDHRRARGVIIDAALHEDRNPDGTPDTWAEVLMEVDAVRFPRLAKAILAGHVDRTSMGCDVERSVCSACGNVATTPAEYCSHIPRLKGQRLFRQTTSGKRVGELVRETCYGLSFFENSLLVEPPADPTAHFLGVDARGLGKSAAKTANSTGPFSWDEIGARHPHVYGDSEVHGEEADGADGQGIGEAASHLAHDRPEDPGAEGSDVHSLQFHLQHVNPRHIDFQHHGGGDGRVETASRGYAAGADVPPLVLVHRHGVYQVADGHHRAQAAYERRMDSVPAYVAHSPHPRTPFSDGSKAPFHSAEPAARQRTTPSRTRSTQPTSGPGWEQPKLFAKKASIDVEAARPQFENPGDHPWFKETGLSHEHVLAHWDQATDEEKKQGARWYPDAHHVAKAIAKLHPGITDDAEAAHKGAGVLSAYSPQQNWWANQHNAARSFVQQRAVGKGEGLMVMGSHASAAQRIMDGEDHQKVLKGPKTADFAHLIEHGGYKPQTPEDVAAGKEREHSDKVVMDRHALSVAAGRRLNADDAKGFPSGNRHYYEHAAEHYRTAAAVISDREKRTVPPHEVQAVTWLTRQRLNGEEDKTSPGGKGRATVMRNQRQQWRDLSTEHTPQLKADENSHVARMVSADAILADGSISHLAYGEIKAPQDVDTLREENCPVCGDADTYDGDACQICGFVSPPAQFRDPDLDMAKRLDLRKQVVDPSLVDNNGELQRVDGDGAMPGGEDPQAQMADPEAIGEDGSLPASPYGDQALDGTQHGPGVSDRNGDGMIQPHEIDPEGNANVEDDLADPEMGGQAAPRELPYGAQDHTGQPFTPGPDMPDRPDDPEGPDAFLQDQVGTEEQPRMGQPGDGVSDLLCPSCGFSADATPPQTQNMGNPMAADDGIVAGDVCPSCQSAQLLTPGEMQGGASLPPPAVPGGFRA
ncbi:ParB/RepB/Spo0J family partition protein [Streptomyces yangpuensis]